MTYKEIMDIILHFDYRLTEVQLCSTYIQVDLILNSISALQYCLLQLQKAFFFVHILESCSGNFFFENKNESMQYIDILQVMLKEYVGDAREIQIKRFSGNSSFAIVEEG